MTAAEIHAELALWSYPPLLRLHAYQEYHHRDVNTPLYTYDKKAEKIEV